VALVTRTEPDALDPADVAELLSLLGDVLTAALERVEPTLRRAAQGLRDGGPGESAVARDDWNSCAWCPLCAVGALVRGEHHDLLSLLADHGVTAVTVLREALAGVPVEPIVPPGVAGEPRPAPRRAPAHPVYEPIPITLRS
jgi:hypothetical protein